ncbi:MAG: APC family permease [Dehalococcoidia bacterium]|nr:APC family permease [Dehalococcoidia bacterium]
MVKKAEPKPIAPDRQRPPQRGRLLQQLSFGVFRATEETLAAVEGDLGRTFRWLRRRVFGVPLTTAQEAQERLTKVKGLAVLGSDNLSSSAYATEEIVRVLALAGAGVFSLTLPISFVLVAVLTIVVLSYHQVIRAYPGGGGSFLVSRVNLGDKAGMLAAAALMIDYVLTVAVSVAAGVQALTSVFPELFPFRLVIATGAIILLALGNLRGIREAASLFILPVYVYLVGILGLLGYAFFRLATGSLPELTPPPDWTPAIAGPLSLMLILRAFSSGAVALTGVEAISDGVGVFKPSEPRNARITLTLMALFFAAIFLGLSFFAGHFGLVPDPSEKETLISQLVRLLVGPGWFHVVVQLAAATLLLVAANTAFTGFPRLAYILASEDFMPHQFAGRGERLVFTTGILVLAGLAIFFVIAFQGSVTALIPLYTLGVFVAFTLTQLGMISHSRKVRQRGWRLAMSLNGVGAVVTGVIAVEAITVKFVHGAWLVLVFMPLLVLMMRAIRGHYTRLKRELALAPGDLLPKPARPQLVVMPVATMNKPFAEGLTYARSLSPNITCIHVAETMAAAEEFRRQWEQQATGIPLVTIESPYRNFLSPMLAYIDSIVQSAPETIVTVVIPEFVPKRWWEHFLHRQSALRLKMALLARPNVVVVDIPYLVKT